MSYLLPPHITNKYNLPEEIVKSLLKNRYAGDSDASDLKTDYSVSTLVAPVQQTILKHRYPNCNTEDVIDRLWSMFGSIAHCLLEEHGSDEAIIEKRFYMEVLGKIISGQIDHYKARKISDYKTTSAYKIMKKSYEDWACGQNTYATLCEHNGYPVDSLRIIAIIRDWKDSESSRNKDYPESAIAIIPLIKWSLPVRMRYITARVQALIDNEKLEDAQLLPCTHEERWMNVKDYAVVKSPSTRATKVFDNQEDANADAIRRGSEYHVEKRMTEPRRCLKYCPSSSKCTQHQAYLKGV